jgi:hypothetical protein
LCKQSVCWLLYAAESADDAEATGSRLAAGILSLAAWAAIVGGVEAQGLGKSERTPEPIAPNMKRRPEPLPPSPRPQLRTPRDEMPAAEEDAPLQAPGCPDHGRKLELIA